VTCHELLGKILAALKHGTLLRGTYYQHIGHSLGEIVTDTLHKRILIAHNYHIHSVSLDKLLDCREVKGRKIDILAIGISASIAGSDK